MNSCFIFFRKSACKLDPNPTYETLLCERFALNILYSTCSWLLCLMEKSTLKGSSGLLGGEARTWGGVCEPWGQVQLCHSTRNFEDKRPEASPLVATCPSSQSTIRPMVTWPPSENQCCCLRHLWQRDNSLLWCSQDHDLHPVGLSVVPNKALSHKSRVLWSNCSILYFLLQVLSFYT
jgi:hypothetical protein